MILMNLKNTSALNGEKKFLVKAVEIASRKAEKYKTGITNYGFGSIASRIKYDVTIYKITYNTTFLDEPVIASGLICLPKDAKEALPIFSLQHGTVFSDNEIPSKASYSYSEFSMLASTGYVVAMPDYIGYGSSRNIFHPYYDKKHSALAVIDLIRAAKELMNGKKLKYNEQLFLSGYSEGGYVTLAAHYYIEKDSTFGLNVTASAPGAGGYDLPGILKSSVVESKEYPAPAYLAFVLMAYNKTYNWNRPLKDFFSSPYADSLPKYMDGNHYGYSINNKLTERLDKLFNPVFFKELKGQGEIELKKKLQENSLLDWKPKAPIRFYHGTMDEIIPYETSETTYNHFKKQGGKVELIPIDGATHGSAYFRVLLDMIQWVDTFR